MARTIRTPAHKAKESRSKKAAETAPDDLLPPKTVQIKSIVNNPPSVLLGDSLRARLIEDLQRGRNLYALTHQHGIDDDHLATPVEDDEETDPDDEDDDYFTVETMSGEIHRIRRAPPNLGNPPPATPQRYSLMTQQSDDGFEVRMMPNNEGRFANNEIASAMQSEMERLFEEMNARSGKPPPEIKRDEAMSGKLIAVVLIVAMIVTLYFR